MIKDTKLGFDKVNTSFLFLTPIISIIGVIWHFQVEEFHWGNIALLILFYYMSGLSICAGYHRLFAHRAYKAGRLSKVFFLIFGAAAFQNSALKWGTDHRRHHSKVDTEEDPYSIQEGFFYAHMGWILREEDPRYKGKYAKDLLKDPLVVFQDKYHFLIGALFGILLPFLVSSLLFKTPIAGLFLVGFLRIVLLHHVTFLINSAAHVFGSRPYSKENSARDNFLLSLLTFGEGYHNYHHKFQTDYRNGIYWYQFDPSKWLIYILKILGQAKYLKKISDTDILKAKLEVQASQLKTLKESKSFITYSEDFIIFKNNSMIEIQARVQEAQKKWQDLKRDYKKLKRELPVDSKRKLKEARIRLEVAKLEFKASYHEWNSYFKAMDLFYGQMA